MAEANRGSIQEVIFVMKYPDGSVRVSRLNPAGIARLVLDPEECAQLVPAEQWTTSDWHNNPAFVIVKNDANQTVMGECRPVDHPPAPSR